MALKDHLPIYSSRATTSTTQAAAEQQTPSGTSSSPSPTATPSTSSGSSPSILHQHNTSQVPTIVAQDFTDSNPLPHPAQVEYPPTSSSGATLCPPSDPSASSSSSHHNPIRDFFQLPHRPKAPSVRLSYRTEDNQDCNSIYRVPGHGNRNRAVSLSDSGAGQEEERRGGGASIFGDRLSPTAIRPRSSSLGGHSLFSAWSPGGRSIPEEGREGHVSGDRGSIAGRTAEEGQEPNIGWRQRAMTTMSRWTFGPTADEEGLGAGDGLTEEERARIAERNKHDQQVIDLLDVIDPEVGALTTLSDVQNSLFVPNLGRWVDRARYLRLTRPSDEPSDPLSAPPPDTDLSSSSASTLQDPPRDTRSWFARTVLRRPPPTAGADEEKISDPAAAGIPLTPAQLAKKTAAQKAVTRSKRRALAAKLRGRSKDSEKIDEEEENPDQVDDEPIEARGQYMVLPEGLVDWKNWSEEDRAELDDYVRHLLHSRKWKARRTWRGFKQYCSTPLGAFVTIYATLLTFWGAAWVLFLIGWLPAGDRQAYFVEICDQILTALFCVVGIGLAPFRCVDTYHMIFIAHYHRKSVRLYREQGAPPLADENDLPAPVRDRTPANLEEGLKRAPVLTVKEQATLMYHQRKFTKSHTFYRPHESYTHHAFPLDLLIVVVCLLDFHSIFQIALGSSTWSISYHRNWKSILTSIILSFSISCNITAGLVIMVGNRRTRKEDVVRDQLRKAVTEEAVHRKEQKRLRQLEKHEQELQKQTETHLHKQASEQYRASTSKHR